MTEPAASHGQNQKKFLPVREAAKLVSYHNDYVSKLAREGKIEAKKSGRQWLVDIESLKLFSLEAEAEKRELRQRLSLERKKEIEGGQADRVYSSVTRNAKPKNAETTASKYDQPTFALLETAAVFTCLLLIVSVAYSARDLGLTSDSLLATAKNAGAEIQEVAALGSVDDWKQVMRPNNRVAQTAAVGAVGGTLFSDIWCGAKLLFGVSDDCNSVPQIEFAVDRLRPVVVVTPKNELSVSATRVAAANPLPTSAAQIINQYITNPTTIIRETVEPTILEQERVIVRELVEIQGNATGESIDLFRQSLEENLNTNSLTLSGPFNDSTTSPGESGYVLQSTGSATKWVATSTLGFTGGSGTPSAGSVASSTLNAANWQNGYVLQASTTASGGFDWVATSTLGISGSGTVTSVNASVPTGWTVSGNPVTTTGTLAFAYDTGYGAVLTASTTEWATAYSWGDHSAQGYLTDITSQSIENLSDVATITNTYGDLLYWNGTAWADIATSSLGLAITDTTGTLDISDRTNLSVTATGLELSGDAVALASGYNIPLTASTTEWANAAAASHSAVTLAGTPNYLTLSGQEITLNQLDLADDLSTFTSADLAGRLTDETGSGTAVFSASPTFTGTATFATATTSDLIVSSNLTLSDITGGLLYSDGSGGVTASSTLGQNVGGTGFSSYTAGDILYADSSGNLARLGVGSTGQVLKVTGGLPAWGADNAGGGGGSGLWATSTDSLITYPADTSDIILVGGSATSSNSTIFEVQNGDAYFSGNVGIGATAPGAELDVKSGGTSSDIFTIEESSSSDDIFRVYEGSLGAANVYIGDGSGTDSIRLSGGTSDTYFNTAGEFGIGTTSPFAKLSVAGDSYIGGNLTATGTVTLTGIVGGLLYSDSSGNVTATSSLTANNIEDVFLRNDADDTTTGQLTAANFAASSGSATSTFAGGAVVSGTLRAQGSVDQSSLGVDRLDLGVQAGTPRMVFEDAGSTNWLIDNASGVFRWYTPGIERLTLDGSGNLDLRTGGLEVGGTSVLTSGRALQNLTGVTSSGTITFSGLSNGVVQATGGVLSATSSISSAFIEDAFVLNTGDTMTGTLVLPNAGLQLGSSVPFSDSSGTLTLQNVDTLDATTESTIEAALDTLTALTTLAVTNATTTNFAITGLTGALLATNADGTVVATTSIGSNLVDTTGDWTGTFDGQEGSWYIANSFATTSADFWETQQTARTADDLADNSLEDLSDVATITNTYGDLLYWNGTAWADIATSSLNINFSNLVGSVTDAQVDDDITASNYLSLVNWFATTSAPQLTTLANLASVGTISSGTWQGTAVADSYVADDITLTNLTQITNRAISDTTGTLSVARGGTGATSFTANQLLLGNGTGAVSTIATSSLGLAITDTTGTLDISDRTNLAASGGLSLSGDTVTTTGVLEDLNTLGAAASDGQFIVATGAGAFAYESGATARTSLGLGSIAVLNSVDISDNTNLSVSATGLELSGDTIALASGYAIPLTASTTNWNNFYDTPSTVITAGTGLSWGGNTLNAEVQSSDLSNYLTLANWYATTTDALSEGSTNFYYTEDRFTSSLAATSSVASITTLANLTTVGALNSGSIGSGFGNIDIGSSNLDADGTITFAGITDGVVQATSGVLSATSSISSAFIEDAFLLNTGDSISGNLTFSGSAANVALGSNYLSGDGDDEGVYVDSSGNVGIGNASPSGRLDVEGGDVFIGTGTLTNATPSEDLSVTGNVETDGTFYGSGAGLTDIPGSSITADSLNWSAFTDTMTLDATTTIAMSHALNFDSGTFYVDGQNNRIGIGTSSPFAKLSVAGDAYVGGNLTATGTATLAAVTADSLTVDGGTNGAPALNFAGDTNTGIYSASDGTVSFTLNGTAIGHFLSTGFNVQGDIYANWSTGSPYMQRISAEGSPGFSFLGDLDNGMYRPTTDQVGFSTAGSERLRIDSTGNVGIGTTSPFAKLSVAGNTYLGGNLTATGTVQLTSLTGGLLTVDASGNVSTTSVAASNLSDADFGDFTCASGVCTFDTNTVADNEIDYSQVTLADFTNDTNYITNILSESFVDLADTPGSFTNTRVLYMTGSAVTSDADLTFDGSQLTLGGTGLSLSGSTANIALGSNWLSGDGGDEGIYIDGSGNVGIGTTSPYARLSVVGETVASHFTATTTATSTFPTLSVTGRLYDSNGTGGTNGYVLQTTGSGTEWVATSSLGISGGSSVSFGTDNQIPFTNSGGTDFDYSSNFTFDGSALAVTGTANVTGTTTLATGGGNVGIGTTSPDFKLTVAGDIAPESNLTYNLGSSTSRFNEVWAGTTNIGTSTWSISATGPDRFGIFDAASAAGNEYFSILQSGNVGIGTTSPASTLDVWGDLRVGTSSVPTLFADVSTNRLGIGTTSPNRLLTVDGDMSLTGALYDSLNSAGTSGMVLQSTGSGLSWVATSTLGISGGATGLLDNHVFTSASTWNAVTDLSSEQQIPVWVDTTEVTTGSVEIVADGTTAHSVDPGQEVTKIVSASSSLSLTATAVGFDVTAEASFVDSFSVSSQETIPNGVAFSTDGTKMFVVGQNSDNVHEYTLSTGFDVSTASYVDGFSVSGQDAFPTDLAFNDDGTKMFVVGWNDKDINEYTLSTGWDVSTASFVDSFSVIGQENTPHGVAFSSDGTKMFVVGDTGDDVNEYTLSTGFDVSTASFVDSFSVSSQETNPHTVTFNDDGTKMFVAGDIGDDVNEYALSTGWDVSTASFSDNFSIATEETDVSGMAFNPAGTKMFIIGTTGDDVNEYTLSDAFNPIATDFVDSFSISSQDTTPYGLAFNTDGTKMFMVGWDGDDVNEYTLSTGFDVSTASFVDSFSVSSQDNSPAGVTFNTDGTKMFVVGWNGDNVHEYTLSTGFDVSTASYVDGFSVASQDTQPFDVVFNSDGTKMFIMGYANDTVYEYNLSTAFDVSTASYSSNSFSVTSQESFPVGVEFNNDGTKMFIIGFNDDEVNVYTLSTGFDVSSASFSDNFSVAGQDTYPVDVDFNADGTKMFVLGQTDDDVNEYTLADAVWSGTARVSVGEVPGSDNEAYFTKSGTAVSLAALTDTLSLGTTTATARLNVQASSTSDILNLFETGGSEVLTVLEAGDVGVGVSDPDKRLEVFETVSDDQFRISYDATRYADFQVDSAGDLIVDAQGGDVRLNDENLWVCSGGSCPTGTPSGTGNVIVESRLGVGTSSPREAVEIWDNLYVAGGDASGMGTATSTFQGDVLILGKLDVGTIDPIYRIAGVKYATYGVASIGIKEEAAATFRLSEYNEDTGYYEKKIAWNNLEAASDLWLFHQVTDFGTLWEYLTVSLTAGFDGRVFYTKDVRNNALVIKATAPGEVSARFMANRFDWSEWSNVRPDQDGPAHFELDEK